MITLSINNPVVALLVACLVYYLFTIVIDTFVINAEANKIFKVVLLIICLAIVFLGGFVTFR